MTKLAPTLPEGDLNGLYALAPKLVNEPTVPHLVIAVIETKSITTDTASGASTPTVRIRVVEPIGGIDKDLAVQMMRRAREERTGQAVLPIEMEDDLDELLSHVDLETGEIKDEEDDQ